MQTPSARPQCEHGQIDFDRCPKCRDQAKELEALRAENDHAQNNAANLELERDDLAARVGELTVALYEIKNTNWWARVAEIADEALSIPTHSTASRLRDDIYDECAVECDGIAGNAKDFNRDYRRGAGGCAFAIRARKSR